MLVSVNDEYPVNNLPSQKEEEDNLPGKKSLVRRVTADPKFRISSESDRFSSHSKGYPPSQTGKGKLILKPNNNLQKSINRTGLTFRTRMSFGSNNVETNEHNSSSNMTGGLIKQFHTSKFSEAEIQPKEKIPHSSFYLHQITKNSKRPYSRDTGSLGRQSKVSIGFESTINNNHRVRRIQTGVKRNDMIEQMKQFTNEKVGYMRHPSRSIKS